MQLERVSREVTRIGTFTEERMDLDESSRALMFTILRDGLYSDAKKSLSREYLTNASDEHRKLGIENTPIEVTFPNENWPYFQVRDFALGLLPAVYKNECVHAPSCPGTVITHPDWTATCDVCGEKGKLCGGVMFYYGKYGASGNRESSLAVGGLGLGCKSGLAYTDAFTVRSVKDGMEYTLNVYIDETEEGRVAFMGQQPSSEPNGIQVSIPVQPKDFEEFITKTFDNLMFYSVKPIVKGLPDERTIPERNPVITGEGWEFCGSGKPVCVMGEVGYPIDVNKMGELERWEREVLSSAFYIFVEIGSVNFTASREELKYTEKTISAIKAKLSGVRDAMVSKTQEAFAACKSLFEAKTLYHTVVQEGKGFGRIVRNAGAKLEWNGQEVDSYFINFSDEGPHKIITYRKGGRRGRKVSFSYSHTLQCTEGLKLYFDDTKGVKCHYKRRCDTLFAQGAGEVQILQTTDRAALEALLGVPVTQFLSFEAVVPTVPPSQVRAGRGINPAAKAKHKCKVFKLDRDKLAAFGGWRNNTASNVWTIEDVFLENGIYVTIDRFHPVGAAGQNNLIDFREILNKLEKAGVKCELPIYGLKKGADAGELVEFSEWMKTTLENNTGLLEEYALALASDKFNPFDVASIDETNLPHGETRDYITLYRMAQELESADSYNARYYVLYLAGIKVEANRELKEASDRFMERFPLLKLVDSSDRGREEALEYIKEREEKFEQKQSN